MSLTRMNAPAISTRGLMNILQLMMPRRLNADMTMFDVGYEACKRDLAVVLGKELNLEFSENPASDLLKQLRHTDAL